jgi:hypothetical protein
MKLIIRNVGKKDTDGIFSRRVMVTSMKKVSDGQGGCSRSGKHADFDL